MLNMLMLLAATAQPAPPAPVAPRCRPAADQATVQLRAADGAIARHDFRHANVALDAALRALGDAYAASATIDDTGMHLVLAESRRREGKPKLAAELKRRILLERLQLCRQPGAAATPTPSPRRRP